MFRITLSLTVTRFSNVVITTRLAQYNNNITATMYVVELYNHSFYTNVYFDMTIRLV